MLYYSVLLFCWCMGGGMQVALVSATLPHEILEMTNKFMTDPVRILVKRDELTLEVGGGVACSSSLGERQGWGLGLWRCSV